MNNRILILVLAICLTTNLKGQSLEETKSWILSKLNRYQTETFGAKLKGNCDSYLQSFNYISSFQKDTLLISYDVKVMYPDCFKGDKAKDRKESAKKVIAKIPISDISVVSTTETGNRFTIRTRMSTIRFIASFDSGNTESFTELCTIGLNLKTENELFERLQKAFSKLQSYYPKKEQKEAF